MKTAIFITTYNRPNLLYQCLNYIVLLTANSSYDLFVINDGSGKKHDGDYSEAHNAYKKHLKKYIVKEENTGIAKAKNTCLSLAIEYGYDHIFLFDDDCWPLQNNWMEYFIDAHNKTGFNILTRLDNASKLGVHLQKTYTKNYISIEKYNNSLGCFISLTRNVIETIGGFNINFNHYGFEHCEYEHRAFLAGLNLFKNACVKNTNKYIYSSDIDSKNTKSSISNNNKIKYINENMPLYQKSIDTLTEENCYMHIID